MGTNKYNVYIGMNHIKGKVLLCKITLLDGIELKSKTAYRELFPNKCISRFRQ